VSIRYRITPRAAEDLNAIGRYTGKTWGKTLRDRYLRAMDRCFAKLAENPQMGRPRPDIKDGFYSYPQGSHVIFYQIHDEGIDILGVLHQRMDVMPYFTNPDLPD
jgi:toxin ParE1/3/4